MKDFNPLVSGTPIFMKKMPGFLEDMAYINHYHGETAEEKTKRLKEKFGLSHGKGKRKKKKKRK